MMRTKLVSLDKKQAENSNVQLRMEKKFRIEKQRLINGFADINFKNDISNALDEIHLELGLSPEQAIEVIREAIPNGLNTFLTSDVDRIIETFKEPTIYIGRDKGVVIKIIGTPVIDPFLIKNWVGARDITIDGNAYIYSWS